MDKESKVGIEGKNKSVDHNSIVDQANKLKHIVLFKFKESATEGDIHNVEEAFAKLPSKIVEIDNFEWGINNSPEGLNKGFTHAFLLSFKNEADRDAYLPHPDHKAFVDICKPVEDVIVLDYWTNTN